MDVAYPPRSDWTHLQWALQQQMSPFSAVRGGEVACSKITLSLVVIVIMLLLFILSSLSCCDSQYVLLISVFLCYFSH